MLTQNLPEGSMSLHSFSHRMAELSVYLLALYSLICAGIQLLTILDLLPKSVTGLDIGSYRPVARIIRRGVRSGAC